MGKGDVISGHKYGLWEIRESLGHQNDRPGQERQGADSSCGKYSLGICGVEVVLLGRGNFHLGPVLQPQL